MAALLVSGTAHAQEGTGVLTLEDAIQLARRHAPSMATADASVAVSEAQALEAILLRLPEITGRATINPSGPIRGNAIDSPSGTDLEAITDIFDELGYQLNSSLRATLPLYTFGKILLAEDLADVGLEVAEMRRRKSELELVFNVTRAYLGLQLSWALQDVIDEGTRRLTDAREELENRLLEGDAEARTDLRQLTIEEADLAGRATDNEMLRQLSTVALSYLCGLEGDFEVEELDESDLPALADLEAIQAVAYDNRPDLMLLDRAIEAGELAAALAWRRLAPDLFFALGVTFNYNPLADDQPSPFANDPYNASGFGFLVGLDWRWDWRQFASARRADAEAERVRAQRDEGVMGIELDITQAYYEAVAETERAVAHGEARQAARAWLRQRSIQFDSGLTGYEDLSDPLIAYLTSSASYFQALFESRLARANLALKIGLEQLGPGTGLEGDEAPADAEQAEAEPAEPEPAEPEPAAEPEAVPDAPAAEEEETPAGLPLP